MSTIVCESCGTVNPDNVKFCKQCGTRLIANKPQNVPATMEAAPSGNQVCTKCGYVNPAGATHCEQCHVNLSVIWDPAVLDEEARKNLERQRQQGVMQAAAVNWPPRQKPGARLPVLENRYGTLRSIAALCRIIGYVFGGLGVISGLIGFIMNLSNSFLRATGTLLGALAGAVIVFVFWVIIAESISVILDIEENTRKSTVLLQEYLNQP